MKISVKPYIQTHEPTETNKKNRRKISITNLKSKKTAAYVYMNFVKQYHRALEHEKVGEMVTWKQMLGVLSYMGFVDNQPTQLDIQLSRTLTFMLSSPIYSDSFKAVSRINLLKFLTILCDIQQPHEQHYENIEELSGLPADCGFQDNYQPLVIIKIGEFDSKNKWTCTAHEQEQIRQIFCSMKMNRISKNQVQSRKRNCPVSYTSSVTEDFNTRSQTPLQTVLFKPKINQKSAVIAQRKIKLKGKQNQRVENRLLLSKENYKRKIAEEMNRSIEKQLSECTFKPRINSIQRNSCAHLNRSGSSFHRYSHEKENMKNSVNLNRSISSCQGVNALLSKGQQYKNRREKLHELKIKLEESAEMAECTFKPHTTKHISSGSKWAFVRNRQKQIGRLEQGRKTRQFSNTMKARGYPTGINWNKFVQSKYETNKNLPNNLNKSMNYQSFLNQSFNQPILCIDLKILQNHNTINVFENQNISQITKKVTMQNNIPQKFTWKVEQLIKTAIEKCQDVVLRDNLVISRERSSKKPRKLYY